MLTSLVGPRAWCAIRQGEGCAGVLFMNGAPIVVEQWADRLKIHPGLKVHITSGITDQTLPHAATGWVKGLLESGGAKVSHKFHPGGHEIGGADVLTSAAKFVAGLLSE